MTLRKTLDQLAQTFAEGVLEAIRSASLEDILTSKGGETARLAVKTSKGRTPRAKNTPAKSSELSSAPKSLPDDGPNRREDTEALTTLKRAGRARATKADPREFAGPVLAELTKHPKGLRSDQLQKLLTLSKGQLVPVLTWALTEKRITKTGHKRSTTYHAAT